ncbi:MAG: hypothetical protein HY048_02780 [Acidobacteria bacterium]|nr:hypothetical protein [Acidobacteriota bacterium]
MSAERFDRLQANVRVRLQQTQYHVVNPSGAAPMDNRVVFGAILELFPEIVGDLLQQQRGNRSIMGSATARRRPLQHVEHLLRELIELRF